MNREKLEALPKKQFWIEDDDYSKPHTFIELDQAIAALTDEQPQKVGELERLPTLEEVALTLLNCKRQTWGFEEATMEELMEKGQDSAVYPHAKAILDLFTRRLAEQTPEPNRAVVSQPPVDWAQPGAIEKYVPGFGRSKEEVIPVYAAPQPTAVIEEVVKAAEQVVLELTTEHEVTPGLVYLLRDALAHLREAKHGQ